MSKIHSKISSAPSLKHPIIWTSYLINCYHLSPSDHLSLAWISLLTFSFICLFLLLSVSICQPKISPRIIFSGYKLKHVTHYTSTTLMTPLDLTQTQRSTGPRHTATSLSVTRDFCWVASGPRLVQIWICINLVDTNCPTQVAPWDPASWVCQWLSLRSSQQLTVSFEVPWFFCWLSPGSVLTAANLGS